MAGPANVKAVEFARGSRQQPSPTNAQNEVITKADVRHARMLGGVVGFVCGLVVMFLTIWTATMWTAETTVDTFGRGVALGKATTDGH